MYHILTRNDCKWCDKAKELLTEVGEAYSASSIDDNPLLVRLLIKADLKTVPQIWHGAEYVGGYDNLVDYLNANSNDPI